jgi:hypothetical protein
LLPKRVSLFLWHISSAQLKNFIIEDEFRTAKDIGLYEDELYFISQMYEDDWQPRDSVIDFDDGTVNDVPLHEYS